MSPGLPRPLLRGMSPTTLYTRPSMPLSWTRTVLNDLLLIEGSFGSLFLQSQFSRLKDDFIFVSRRPCLLEYSHITEVCVFSISVPALTASTAHDDVVGAIFIATFTV